MKPGGHHKIIQHQACHKTNEQQAYPGNRKRQPKNEQVIYIWSDQPVQVRYFIQYIYLYQDKHREAEDIS
jgi:hypothetical protein